MEGFSLLGLNLPFYVVITLLLAYFIWSKFLKEGALKPDNVNDLLDIFSIFIFLIVALISVTSFFMIVTGWLNLSLNIPNILDAVPYWVAFFALLIIWLLTINYRNKKVSIRDLKSIFINSMRFFLIVGAIYLGLFLLIFFTALKYALQNLAFLPAWMVLTLIFICYLTVNNIFGVNFRCDILGIKAKRISEIKIKQDILDNFVIRILAVMLLVVIVLYFYIPIVKCNEPIYKKYHIFDPDPRWGEVYLQTKIPISIKTFGEFGAITPLIPIYYEPYNLETTGTGAKNFKIFVNSTKEKGIPELIGSFEDIKTFQKKSGNKFSFTDVILDEGKGSLILKFNRETIKDEGITQIILEGFVRKNTSELDYSYHDNSRLSNTCNQYGCTFIFNITNNLNLPVYFEEYTLINFKNLKITNKSNCRFVNATGNFPLNSNIRMIDSPCHGYSCELQTLDVTSGKYVFYMRLYLDGDVVTVHRINIEKPIKVNAQFELVC